ncbi:Palmitoyltransferase ZDHHC6, partial [Blattella germanica]
IRSILRNQTGIEDWIVEKAHHRRDPTDQKFIYPYNLGWKNNIKQVINFSCDPVGNGLTWPVVEGCDQYTLTKTKKFIILANSMTKCTKKKLKENLQVLCHPPFTDEPRIPLTKGDRISVTRWRR